MKYYIILKIKKIGKWLVATLNNIETNHCKISIDRNNIRWKDLKQRDVFLLKTYLDNNKE